MSLFRHVTRVWCEVCPRRTLLTRTRRGVCWECILRELARIERDEERAALRGASDEQLERF